MLLGTLALSIERLVTFHNDFNGNISASEALSEHKLDECKSWTCISDFTFAILLMVNAGKN